MTYRKEADMTYGGLVETAAEQTPARVGRVGISLMVSSDTTAVLEYLEEAHPDARIDFRDCFYKIERDGRLTFKMDEISECAGRDIDTATFLVNMSSYYGRISAGDGRVDIVADDQM
jgi:propane monooxygenase coupling protein